MVGSTPVTFHNKDDNVYDDNYDHNDNDEEDDDNVDGQLRDDNYVVDRPTQLICIWIAICQIQKTNSDKYKVHS